METTVLIDGKECKLKSSAAIPVLYRSKFAGRDILVEMEKMGIYFSTQRDVYKRQENIYVDDEQFEKYIGLAKYFPWKTLMPWQKFVVGLHDCTYYKDTKEPRWPDLFCLIGRGAGKDGTIAWESVCLTSPYNPIKAYDVDICANNEEQAMRPVQDIIEAVSYTHLDVYKRQCI